MPVRRIHIATLALGLVGVLGFTMVQAVYYFVYFQLQRWRIYPVLPLPQPGWWFLGLMSLGMLYVLWPRDKPPIHRALWLSIAFVAIPGLMYQNSGWRERSPHNDSGHATIAFSSMSIAAPDCRQTVAFHTESMT